MQNFFWLFLALPTPGFLSCRSLLSRTKPFRSHAVRSPTPRTSWLNHWPPLLRWSTLSICTTRDTGRCLPWVLRSTWNRRSSSGHRCLHAIWRTAGTLASHSSATTQEGTRLPTAAHQELTSHRAAAHPTRRRTSPFCHISYQRRQWRPRRPRRRERHQQRHPMQLLSDRHQWPCHTHLSKSPPRRRQGRPRRARQRRQLRHLHS